MSELDVVNDFEAWATVSARLIHKNAAQRELLLARLGLTLVWKNANDAWSNALAHDIVDMRLQRAQRYAEICATVFDQEGAELDEPAVSISDELSLQTTHRMRAHAAGDGPPSGSDQPPSERSFIDNFTPTNVVARPQRKQAMTFDAPRSFELPSGDHGLTSDTGPTSIIDASSSAWPLQRYARYVAEREAGHESEEAVDSRYGLAADERRRITQQWDTRLAHDTALKQRFELLIIEHTESMNTRRH